MTYNGLQGIFTTMIGFVTWPPFAMYGEYRVVSIHSNLACECQKWFKSEKQRHSKIN